MTDPGRRAAIRETPRGNQRSRHPRPGDCWPQSAQQGISAHRACPQGRATAGLPQKQIADALQARESLGSTGVGAGIAIPHAQFAGLDRFHALFGRLSRPIDYDAIDGHPVDLVFLLLIPANSKEHLQALVAISRRLRNQAVAANLRQAGTSRELYDAVAAD